MVIVMLQKEEDQNNVNNKKKMEWTCDDDIDCAVIMTNVGRFVNQDTYMRMGTWEVTKVDRKG